MGNDDHGGWILEVENDHGRVVNAIGVEVKRIDGCHVWAWARANGGEGIRSENENNDAQDCD